MSAAFLRPTSPVDLSRYLPQLGGDRCPSLASFGYAGVPSFRCELPLGHEDLCEAHDGAIRWVWGKM